jgi:hypothetical protein
MTNSFIANIYDVRNSDDYGIVEYYSTLGNSKRLYRDGNRTPTFGLLVQFRIEPQLLVC